MRLFRHATCRPLALTLAALAVWAAPANGQASLEWAPCPATDGTECAVVELAIDPGDPSGGTMPVGVRRVLGAGTGMRQLWYLAGGPGDAVGGALGRIAELLGDPELDIYGVDHRGTGASADLRCPEQEAPASFDGSDVAGDEWPACIEYIRATRSDLEALSTTGAAHDLARLIELAATDRERSGDQRPEVFVFGASYGSFWANRYLALYPDQPTGVILDGIVPADWSFAEFDASLDATAREWLRRCGEAAGCGDRFDGDPAAAAAGVIAALDDGHCPAIGINGAMARLLFGAVIMVDDIPSVVIPAMVQRWRRCEWSDEMALMHFVRSIVSGVGEDATTHSLVLQRHVALSELWNADDPSSAELEAALEQTIATTDVSASFAATRTGWPVYEPPANEGMQATFDGPMLLLHGGLDPTMPVARLTDVATHYSGPRQTFVVVPDAGHVTLNFTTCVRDLYRAFLTAPAEPLDTGCVGEESLVSFAIDDAASESLFGTADFWGDATPLASTVWFKFRYRWLPLLAGIIGLGVLGAAATQRRDRRTRHVVVFVVWLSIVFIAYVLAASTPLLIDYASVPATVSALAIVAVQALVCGGLTLWQRAGEPPVPSEAAA